MKKLLSVTILLAIAMIAFVACNDDDDDDNQTNQTELAVVGQWTVSGLAVDEGVEYSYTGTMDITSSTMTVDFEQVGTGDHGALIKEKCAITDNTIRWGTGGEYMVFSYSLSADKNTLTLTYTSGTEIDDFVIRTMTAKRVVNGK